MIDLRDYLAYQEPLPKEKWPYKMAVRPTRLRALRARPDVPPEEGGCPACAGHGGRWVARKQPGRMLRVMCAACGGTGRKEETA